MKQPWLNSLRSDCLFILSPPFVSLLIVFLLPKSFQAGNGMPVIYWLILVVFIDVAHVYATLYRTYFNRDRLKRLQNILILIPLFCYISGVLLYQVDGMIFWRVLAYLAVFHFIRQQYGFMRLYSRFEKTGKINSYIDGLAVYTATVYPLLYWHFDANRNFSWFVEGDFLMYPSNMLMHIATVLYVLIIVIYLIKEIVIVFLNKQPFNIPRNMLMVGTYLSWYFGIVYFNGDVAFTVLNVISHGIPYVALIRFFEKKEYEGNPLARNAIMKASFGRYGIPVFLGLLLLLAYVEEGLWDGLIWKEHGHVFGFFIALPQLNDAVLLSMVVPLLALPQATHYVLDGFIWRKNKS